MARRGDGLRVVGEGELPDSKLTERQREALKRTAADIAEESDEHELMFLAGALEAEALKKRGLA